MISSIVEIITRIYICFEYNLILLFTIQNIGSPVSATSIKEYLKHEHRDVSIDIFFGVEEESSTCGGVRLISKNGEM